MKMQRIWEICFVFTILCILPESSGVFDLTIVNEYPILRSDEISYLKCVSGDSEVDQDAFKRVQDTGSGTRLPSYSLVGPISSEGWPGRRLSLFTDSGLERAGVFSCQAKDGATNILKKAIALKMGSGGDVWPEHFTYTASVDERDMVLQFKSFDPTTPVTWKFQGHIMSVSSMTYKIDVVTRQHGGIYECYSSQGNNPEEFKKKALIRLIVRECAKNKWGFPGCANNCDCLNGGACDEMTGECLCPPGFKGSQCEVGCGSNKFGSSCQYKCKEGRVGSDRDEGCRGKQFCLQDPYGCSCATGFSGFKCINGCPMGYFGAGCQIECHCKRQDLCNRFTGSCPLGCASGWQGASCQLNCEDGKWGENCENQCRCYGGEICDKVNGKCPGGRCEPPFAGESCQIDSIDECSSSPCQNGGTCIDDVYQYSCDCLNGTSGVNCEVDIDECTPNPCENGGVCRDEGPLKFVCFCADGYTGELCSTNIDDCVDNKCENGATCVDDVNTYSCDCKDDFNGDFCELRCQPGTFYDENEKSCESCPEDSYQSSFGATACQPCLPGFKTDKKGATSDSDCKKAKAEEEGISMVLIGGAAGGGVVLIIIVSSVYYYFSHKNKTRLQHIGPGRSAW